MDRIVIGYDGSEHAERALSRAVELTEKLDARLEVVCVVSAVETPTASPDAFGAGPHDAVGPVGSGNAADELAQSMLQKAQRSIGDTSIEVEFVTEMGDPAERLLERSDGARLLVVGRHHHHFLGRVFGDSVSDEVVRHGGCDVLVVS